MLSRIFKLITSFGLVVVLLFFLLLLTFFGTLEQVNIGLFEVQQKYFESLFVVHYLFGVVPLPLPGVYLLMALLMVNLTCGALVRARKNWKRPGMLIAHSGMLFMLVSGAVTYHFSTSGYLQLYENQQSDEFISYYDWEITLTKADGAGAGKQYVITREMLGDMRPQGRHKFQAPDLPFDLELESFTKNSATQRAPMAPGGVDGIALVELKPALEAEQNMAGAYATVKSKASGAEQRGILWGFAAAPWTVEVDGEAWKIDLRHIRWKLARSEGEAPFTILLDDFIKEEHPGTTMASSFMSKVTKIEGGLNRKIEIKMNEPLRHNGFTLFQSSWGHQNGDPALPVFSTFSVVKNPADQWPKYSCYIVAIGLTVHFLQKLMAYIRRENRRRTT